jgi:hypothetical protein
MPRKDRQIASRPSDDVGEILRVVNLLPPNALLKGFGTECMKFHVEDSHRRKNFLYQSETVRELVRNRGSESSVESDRLSAARQIVHAYSFSFYENEALKVCLVGLPLDFITFVGPPKLELESQFATPLDETRFREWMATYRINPVQFEPLERSLQFNNEVRSSVLRYTTATAWHENLYALVHEIETLAHRVGKFGRPQRVSRNDNPNWFQIVNNRVVFEPDRFEAAFGGIPADRLKRCKNCGRVFWVKRLGTRACGPTCTSVLSTRKWREKTSGEQRQKYKINRALKELEKETS